MPIGSTEFGIGRPAFSSDVPPAAIALRMIAGLAVAAFLVYAALARATRARTDRRDAARRRDALQLRLTESPDNHWPPATAPR